MTGWRAKAAELLPELSAALHEGWSVHLFLWELQDLLREAHRAKNLGVLRRGYCFADWCLNQPERFLANAAAVSFYEHIFDDWEMRHEVLPWLPAQAIEQVRALWEWRLPADRLLEVDRLVGGATQPRPHIR